MNGFLERVRHWFGLDTKPAAKRVPDEDIARAEDEGMTAPDVAPPTPPPPGQS